MIAAIQQDDAGCPSDPFNHIHEASEGHEEDNEYGDVPERKKRKRRAQGATKVSCGVKPQRGLANLLLLQRCAASPKGS